MNDQMGYITHSGIEQDQRQGAGRRSVGTEVSQSWADVTVKPILSGEVVPGAGLSYKNLGPLDGTGGVGNPLETSAGEGEKSFQNNTSL